LEVGEQSRGVEDDFLRHMASVAAISIAALFDQLSGKRAVPSE
jgi:hypothetical protein